MSNWITDRRPTEADSDRHGYVWVTHSDGEVYVVVWDRVTTEPWAHTNIPEPYVKPKRYTAAWLEGEKVWGIFERGFHVDTAVAILYVLSNEDKHREAAERIAAIYEEVAP